MSTKCKQWIGESDRKVDMRKAGSHKDIIVCTVNLLLGADVILEFEAAWDRRHVYIEDNQLKDAKYCRMFARLSIRSPKCRSHNCTHILRKSS